MVLILYCYFEIIFTCQLRKCLWNYPLCYYKFNVIISESVMVSNYIVLQRTQKLC